MVGNEPSQERRPRRWLVIELWVVLMVLAGAHALWNLLLCFDRNDTMQLETTLARVVAGQLVDGPSTIYGPYSRANMRVLIHAPLYYRLAGLLAWPLVGRTMSPTNAAFVAGRAISLASFLGLTWVVARIARLDGATRRAGAWAAALPLTTLVVDTYPVTVRPDVAGVFLQTFGVYLVLRVTLGGQPPARSLAGAYAAFALAACIKQHDVGSALVSTIMLAGSWVRRKDWRRAIERAWLAGLAIVAGYYLFEEVFTGGGISFSLVKVPGELRRLAKPGLWVNFGMLYELTRRSLVPLGLALGCLFASPGVSRRERLDRILWAFLLVELVLVDVLCYRNEGAWINYALQSVVYASLLIGRALARVAESSLPAWRVVPLSLIAAFLVYSDLSHLHGMARSRASEETALHALIRAQALPGWSRRQFYFLGLPHYNRLYGRADWVHDEWLYGQFERIKAAPSRATWLRKGLTNGDVRLVITPRDPPFAMELDPPVPPGLPENLKDLGYELVMQLDRFKVWERRRPPRPAGRLDALGPAP